MNHNKEFNTALLEYFSINSQLGDIESKISSLTGVMLSKIEIQSLIKEMLSLRDRIMKNVQFLRGKFTLTASDEEGYLMVAQDLEQLENKLESLKKNILTEEEKQFLVREFVLLRKKIIESTRNLIIKFGLDEEKVKMCDTLLQNIVLENQSIYKKTNENAEDIHKM